MGLGGQGRAPTHSENVELVMQETELHVRDTGLTIVSLALDFLNLFLLLIDLLLSSCLWISLTS